MVLLTSTGRWFLMLIILQARRTSKAITRNDTICFNSRPVSYHYECNFNQKLLPRKLIFGNTSEVVCHMLIRSALLHTLPHDIITECCKQRQADASIEYCLPAKGNTINEQYYVDLINDCTGVQSCSLPPPTNSTRHATSEDYVTFLYDCIDDSSILHMKSKRGKTGKEVYLYNVQNDGPGQADCVAYTLNCLETVTTEVVASNFQSPLCNIQLNDGTNFPLVDCKNPPPTPICSVKYQSKNSSYMNISITMTTDPGKSHKEFLWIKVTASANSDVTVACGSMVPQHVTSVCPSIMVSTTATASKLPSTASDRATSTAAAAPPNTITVTTASKSPDRTTFTPPSTPSDRKNAYMGLIGESQLWIAVVIVLGVVCIALSVALVVLCRAHRKLKNDKTRSGPDESYADIPMTQQRGDSPNSDRPSRSHRDVHFNQNPLIQGPRDFYNSDRHSQSHPDERRNQCPLIERRGDYHGNDHHSRSRTDEHRNRNSQTGRREDYHDNDRHSQSCTKEHRDRSSQTERREEYHDNDRHSQPCTEKHRDLSSQTERREDYHVNDRHSQSCTCEHRNRNSQTGSCENYQESDRHSGSRTGEHHNRSSQTERHEDYRESDRHSRSCTCEHRNRSSQTERHEDYHESDRHSRSRTGEHRNRNSQTDRCEDFHESDRHSKSCTCEHRDQSPLRGRREDYPRYQTYASCQNISNN